MSRAAASADRGESARSRPTDSRRPEAGGKPEDTGAKADVRVDSLFVQGEKRSGLVASDFNTVLVANPALCLSLYVRRGKWGGQDAFSPMVFPEGRPEPRSTASAANPVGTGVSRVCGRREVSVASPDPDYGGTYRESGGEVIHGAAVFRKVSSSGEQLQHLMFRSSGTGKRLLTSDEKHVPENKGHIRFGGGAAPEGLGEWASSSGWALCTALIYGARSQALHLGEQGNGGRDASWWRRSSR